MSQSIPRNEGSFYSHDGTRIFYEEYGGGAVTMVLVDGIGCFGYVWPKWLKNFPRYMRVVHMHYRGHGKSDPPAVKDNVDIADLARDLQLMFNELDIDQAVLVGHSMGVQVILEFAHLFPDRAAGLIPVCGSYGRPLDTFNDSKMLGVLFPFIQKGLNMVPGIVRPFWRHAIPTELGYRLALLTELNPDFTVREEFFPYLQDISTVDPILFLAMLGKAAQHTARPFLADLDMPTLIIGGEQDGFTPGWISQEMVRLMPDAEIEIIKGGSHTAPLEFDEHIQLRVEKWLTTRFQLPIFAPV